MGFSIKKAVSKASTPLKKVAAAVTGGGGGGGHAAISAPDFGGGYSMPSGGLGGAMGAGGGGLPGVLGGLFGGGGGGAPQIPGLGGLFGGGGDASTNGPFGQYGPFGSAGDPWHLYTKKAQVDNTKATVDFMNKNAPSFKPAQTASGALQVPYTTNASKAIAAGTVKNSLMDTKKLGANTASIDAMRARATAKGDSPWLKLQMQQQGLGEKSLRDQAARQAMTGAANTNSMLAMNGGLGAGARERAAAGATRDMNAARQQIGRQGLSDRLNLSIADDNTKMGLLGQSATADLNLAGQNQGMAQFNAGQTYDANKLNVANTLDANKFNSAQQYDASKTNAANALQANTDQNKYNAYLYGEKMKGYGASKTADATVNAGKK